MVDRIFDPNPRKNPLVPLGMIAMVICVLKGIHHTNRGDISLGHRYGQVRVTIVVSILAFFMISSYLQEQRWERDVSHKRELNKYRDWKAEERFQSTDKRVQDNDQVFKM